MRQVTAAFMALLATGAFLYLLSTAITDPNYQANLTTRYQAREQTRQVQAQQWGATVRGTVPWVAGGVAVVGGLVAIGWATVKWQEQRTKRHEATEGHMTQRHLITAQKDIVLAYLAQCGDPRAYAGQLDGQRGVFLPKSGEFVPESICRAELAGVQAAAVPVHTTALARRQPQTINVPGTMESEDWLPIGLPGASEGRFIVRGGW
jgi:hypothetical protein